MSQPLYWSIEKFPLRYAYFLFFDTIPYLADQLFIRRQVRVWFDQEYAKRTARTLRSCAMSGKKMCRSFWTPWRI